MSAKDLFTYNVEETPIAEQVCVSGCLPKWLTGTYYKIGNGKFTLPGGFEVNHYFDGYSVIYQYVINDNKVKFRSKYLNSDAYKEAMEVGKPTYAGVATRQHPHPNKNAVSRMVSHLIPTEVTDNNAISIFALNDQIYATADGCFMHQIDPDSLQSVNKLDLLKQSHIMGAAFHCHKDKTGALYTVGVTMKKGTFRNRLMKIVAKTGKTFDPKQDITFLTKLTQKSLTSVSFAHSFGMTQNYFVMIKQPVKANLISFLTGQIQGKTIMDCINWNPEKKTKFFVVDRATNNVITTNYISQALCFMHIANAYEENGCIIIDLIVHRSIETINLLMLNKIRNEELTKSDSGVFQRFVLPITNIPKDKNSGNLVKLSSTKAQAVKVSEDTVLLTSETLFDVPLNEFININDNFDGQKYRFAYSANVIFKHSNQKQLIKLDVEAREIKTWKSGNDNHFATEPIFVPNPDGTEEDDGIVIAAVAEVEKKQSMLVFLDGKSFTEIARAEFNYEINMGNHGTFIFNK